MAKKTRHYRILMSLTLLGGASCGIQPTASGLKVMFGQKSDHPWAVYIHNSASPDFPRDETTFGGTGSLLCPNVVMTAGHVVNEKYLRVEAPPALLAKLADKQMPAAGVPSVWAEVEEQKLIRYDTQKEKRLFDDGVALVKLRYNALGEKLRPHLQDLAFPRLGRFAAWPRGKPMSHLTLLGYGTKFDRAPGLGALWLDSLSTGRIKFQGKTQSMPEALLNLRIRMDSKQHLSVTNSQGTLVYDHYQYGESGDSGGAMLLSGLSSYIFGVYFMGMDHKAFQDELARKEGHYNSKGELTNKDFLGMRYFSFMEQFASNWAYNVAAEPARSLIIETLEEWCDVPYEDAP